MPSSMVSWWKILLALIYKEFKQIIRDPSSYIVAIFLPLVYLFFFGYAINLDATITRVALVNECPGAAAQSLSLSFTNSPHFLVFGTIRRAIAKEMLQNSQVEGVIIIPQNFDTLLAQSNLAPIQLLINGADPNTANFVRLYTEGLVSTWQANQITQLGLKATPPLTAMPSFWYNPAAISQWALVPGSITVVMTLIGTVLTSLVITREWERGTMEALISTPITRLQLFLSKLIPYYTLAMGSMLLCVLISYYLFKVPFHGSLLALLIVSSAFLMPALGQGLFISSLFRSQLLSAMVGFLSGMLPALILSGLLFDIRSMPQILQYITLIIPARYFNVVLQTLFLAGDLWEIFWPAIGFMLSLGLFFFALAYKNMVKRLD